MKVYGDSHSSVHFHYMEKSSTLNISLFVFHKRKLKTEFPFLDELMRRTHGCLALALQYFLFLSGSLTWPFLQHWAHTNCIFRLAGPNLRKAGGSSWAWTAESIFQYFCDSWTIPSCVIPEIDQNNTTVSVSHQLWYLIIRETWIAAHLVYSASSTLWARWGCGRKSRNPHAGSRIVPHAYTDPSGKEGCMDGFWSIWWFCPLNSVQGTWQKKKRVISVNITQVIKRSHQGLGNIDYKNEKAFTWWLSGMLHFDWSTAASLGHMICIMTTKLYVSW